VTEAEQRLVEAASGSPGQIAPTGRAGGSGDPGQKELLRLAERVLAERGGNPAVDRLAPPGEVEIKVRR
jgi:hypothetical protein